MFKAYVYVDSEGSEFNGYDAVIRWDPEILEPLSAQPESLFGEHAQWWFSELGQDSVWISHAILEGGASVTGPGPLSSITFRALDIGESAIAFDHIEFYLGPFEVTPVVSQDAIVFVTDATSGFPQLPLQTDGPRLSVWPNPVGSASRIVLSLPRGTAGVLRVLGPDGRLLRQRAVSSHGTASRVFSWDFGSLLDLTRSSAGVYFLQLATDHGNATTRVMYIR